MKSTHNEAKPAIPNARPRHEGGISKSFSRIEASKDGCTADSETGEPYPPAGPWQDRPTPGSRPGVTFTVTPPTSPMSPPAKKGWATAAGRSESRHRYCTARVPVAQAGLSSSSDWH